MVLIPSRRAAASYDSGRLDDHYRRSSGEIKP